MRSNFIQDKTTELQNNLYSQLNKFSQTNKTLGRFCSIPVSILDVALDTLRSPLHAIEQVAMVAINLIGAVFSTEYSLRDALFSTESALASAVNTPVKLAMAPFKIIFQLFAIIINPEKVHPLNYQKKTTFAD